ncbi:MAG: hypothetical protein ABIH25_01730 [Candidatus Woesearchaeota archaeon]
MLDKVRNIYYGTEIAVLGSAPSVMIFNRGEDIVIGVNGAGYLLHGRDIFLSGDQAAHTRSWFLDLDEDVQCIIKPHSAIYSPKFYPDEKIRNKFINEYEKYMDEKPSLVKTTELGLRWVSSRDEHINNLFLQLPSPSEPHLLMHYIAGSKNPVPVSRRHQKAINVGGTSACMALQVAHVMGASSIHLYGVEFSNEVSSDSSYYGGNYFYKPKLGETGRTLPSQREFMDRIILETMAEGTRVFSHGPTALENTFKVEY